MKLIHKKNIILNFKGKSKRIIVNGVSISLSFPPSIIDAINETYINSLSSQYVGYGFDEWRRNNKSNLKNQLFKLPVKLIQLIFFIIYDRNSIFINNKLWSTNLYPNNFNKIVNDIIKLPDFKNTTLIFRNINHLTNVELNDFFIERKSIKIANRKVMVFDYQDPENNKKRPLQTDLKKWDGVKHKYQWREINANETNVIEKCLFFYSKLYLKKYSEFNPAYTISFISEAINNKDITIEILTEIENPNEILACLGFAENNIEITNPFIGYDEFYKEIPLYRMINVRMMTLARQKNKIYNMSSGATDFKMQRGGKPIIEYHYIINNRSKTEKLKWRILEIISEKIIEPILLKH